MRRATPVGRWVVAVVLWVSLSVSLHGRLLAQRSGTVQPLCASGCLTYGVRVTPTTAADTEPTLASGLAYVFSVQNTGTGSDTDVLTCTAYGPIACDSLTVVGGPHGGTSVTIGLGGGQSAEVTAWATTGRTTGSADVELDAVDDYGHDANGTYGVAVVKELAPVVALVNPNGAELARGRCFTSGAGTAAGVSCGDLFVVHAMPAYRTLGKDRALTLEYNSAAATGLLLVAAAVTQPIGTRTPSAVKAVLQVGTVKDSASFTAFGPGTTEQLGLGRGLAALATGVYPVTLAVTNVYATASYTATVTGQVLVVNRATSPFGRGWALDGVEQLVFGQPGGGLLWVDGDGSARLYGQLNSSTWVAPAAGFRDTITYDAGSQRYTRFLRHGVKVVFNAGGQHILTYNRLGDTTAFAYSIVAGQSRLTSITVPPNDTTLRQYRLCYNPTTATLDSILDPGGRRLRTVLTGGQLTALTDPDGRTTSFEYGATHLRLTRQVMPRPELGAGAGYGTVYVYGHNARVTQVKIPAGPTGGDTLRYALTPWDEQGLASGPGATGQAGVVVPSGGLATLVDGPISGVGDQLQVWVNGFGEPTRTILTGTGATTTITYGDAAHPALATQVVSPTGLVTRMHYNARGNPDTLWQSSPDSLSGLPNRRSTWAYGDANTPDGPTQVRDPLGRTTTYAYTGLGLTDSVIDSRGHHTDFGYVTGGHLAGLVDTVTERAVATWRQSDSTEVVQDQRTRFTYDTDGNVIQTTSPIGTVTSYVLDAFGRVTDVYDPLGTRSARTYDSMNRVTQTTQYTTAQANPYGIDPLAGCDATQVVCADSTHAADPVLPATLTTRYFYGGAGVDSVVDPRGVLRRYGYNADGVQGTELDDYGVPKTAYYGADGLLDSVITRDTITIRFRYDSVGRRIALIYPERDFPTDTGTVRVAGDSVAYTYDVVGRVRSIANRNTVLGRSYFADGSLRSETSTYGGTDSLAFGYDSAGARIRRIEVDALTPVDSVRYLYSRTTGDLDSLVAYYGGLAAPYNVPRAFAFQWDSLGRRRAVTYPAAASGNLRVQYAYDALGVQRRLAASHTSGGSGHDVFAGTIITDSLVDPIGRILVQRDSRAGRTASAYNRLGWLVRQGGPTGDVETRRYDASGNITWHLKTQHDLPDSMVFAAGHNRIGQMYPEGSAIPIVYSYFGDGSRRREVSSPSRISDRSYYYDGLGRTAGTKTFVWDSIQGASYTVEHGDACRYDGDGRAISPCDNEAPMLSYDGENVLRANPGGNAAHFIDGPATDDPLVVLTRTGGSGTRELFYLTDGAGRQYAVGDSAGTMDASDSSEAQFSAWRWSGGTSNAQSFNASRMAGPSIPGLAFFRNRLYDQATGQWTQEDPAGIGGGINLYQFNGNNPVTFSDPFGLDPCQTNAKLVGLTILCLITTELHKRHVDPNPLGPAPGENPYEIKAKLFDEFEANFQVKSARPMVEPPPSKPGGGLEPSSPAGGEGATGGASSGGSAEAGNGADGAMKKVLQLFEDVIGTGVDAFDPVLMVCPPGQCPVPAAGHPPVPTAQSGPGSTSREEALAAAVGAATAGEPVLVRSLSWFGFAETGTRGSHTIESGSVRNTECRSMYGRE